MAPETDPKKLVAITGKLSPSFVVDADLSGVYFFVLERKSFSYVNLETREQIDLTLENCTIDGEFYVYSTVLCERSSADSNRATVFFGLLWQEKGYTGKLFCALFSSNLPNKTIAIVDIVDASSYYTRIKQHYLYKTKCGKLFALDLINVSRKCALAVSEITQNELGKIDYKTVAEFQDLQCPPNHWSSAFIEDEIVYYFPDLNNSILIKRPFDKNIPSSHIFLSQLSDLNSTHVVSAPVNVNGAVYFCSSFPANKDKTTFIWSLNTENYHCSLHETIHHHCQASWNYRELKIFPDGSAFLHIAGDKSTENPTYIYQIDLSIGSGYTVSQNELGRGGFGAVMEGTIDGQYKVAVKVLHTLKTDVIERKQQILLSAICEARKLKKLNHRNIIKGYGFKIDETHVFLFMELMVESVRQIILRTAEQRLEEKEMLFIVQQAVEGLVYLHTLKPKPIVHRDLKCANILVDENGTVKLGDLGLLISVNLNTAGTTDLSLAPKEMAGTVFWQAPEVLDAENAYGRKADVWSIGCSIVEMLTGYPPYYRSYNSAQWAVLLSRGKLLYTPQELVPESSQDVHNILEKCFRKQIRSQLNVDLAAKDNVPEPIRPHSMEILADLIKINELKPTREKIVQINEAAKRAAEEEMNIMSKIFRLLVIARTKNDV